MQIRVSPRFVKGVITPLCFPTSVITGMESGGESSDEEGSGGGAHVGRQYLRWKRRTLRSQANMLLDDCATFFCFKRTFLSQASHQPSVHACSIAPTVSQKWKPCHYFDSQAEESEGEEQDDLIGREEEEVKETRCFRMKKKDREVNRCIIVNNRN